MTRFEALIHRFESASLKRMVRNAKYVHADKGVSGVLVFFDMIYSFARYHVGYLDYVIFGFADIGHDKRKTYMVMDDNLHYAQKYNAPEAAAIFNDKSRFCETFKKYLHRSFMDLRDEKNTAEKLADFCRGQKAVFVKEPVSFGGLGVQKIDLKDDTDYESLYKYLTENKLFHVEELICQHEGMEKISPRSVNTIRICTVQHGGKANFMYALVRMGNGKVVDNATSGGMYSLVQPDGTLSKLAFCDKAATYYDKHPQSGIPFENFPIPFFKEAVEMCKEASFVVPTMEYVGWDVAITPEGPVLVEGNNIPGYDMPQNHKFHPDHCGLREQFKKAFEED